MSSPKKKTHFSCVLPWEEIRPKEFVFWVITVVSTKKGRRGKPQIKFSGGMGRLNCTPEETPELTAQREALEEMYLSISPESLEKIWEYAAPPDPDKPDEEHTKYGYLVPRNQCRGAIRTEVLRDQDDEGNGDEMSAPYPLSVAELKFVLFKGHQAPFTEACRRLGIS